MRRLSRWLGFGFWALTLLLPKSSSSQPLYYKGKTITVIEGRSPGGVGDLRTKTILPFHRYRMSRVFWGVGTLVYLPPSTPENLAEILRQAFRSSYEDRQFHEQYKKLLGLPSTPLMPEEQQKLVAELPRDTEVVRFFKSIAGTDPLPSRR